MTLIRDIVKIQQYSGDIPQSRLTEIQNDLNTVRDAGFKVIWRISYNTSITTGEPPASVISRHIDQLGPIIQNNIDVIYDVQLGLFGGSGEACCQSNLVFSDPGNNNNFSSLTPPAITLYNKLISYIPSSRNMVVRYPCYKYQLLGWANSANEPLTAYPSAAVPLTASNAFNGSLQARLGFKQDNFAGDEFGYGFFYAWEQKDVDFTQADTKYSLMEGELSASTTYNRQNGEREMKKHHYSAFHAVGNIEGIYDGWDQTSKFWKSSGQYAKMSNKLGYRFRLISGTFPQSIGQGGNFSASLVVKNDGWARIMNARNVEVIFKNKTTGAKYTLAIDGDGRGNRLWLPGDNETKTLTINQPLPGGIPVGQYDLFLNLADPFPSLHDRPEYSIRLGNKNLWDPATGYNALNAVVSVTSATADVVVNFESRPVAETALTGTYAGINWGTSGWATYQETGVSPATKCLEAFTLATTEQTLTFTLPAGKVLKSLKIAAFGNPSTKKVILSSTGNPTRTYTNLTGSFTTYNTNWTTAASTVTVKITCNLGAAYLPLDDITYGNPSGGGRLASDMNFVSKEWENNTKVYPNPFTRELIIESPAAGARTLQIFNNLGQKVYEASFHQRAAIPTHTYKSGNYFIRVVREGTQVPATTLRAIKIE